MTNECRCCIADLPLEGKRTCPECGHVFKGNGWDGIDAHWRKNHENIMPYEEFWQSLCSEHRDRKRNQEAEPNTLGANLGKGIRMTVDDAITAFSKMTEEEQGRFLATLAHDITIVARGTYVPGTEEVADPPRLRRLNEAQHLVVGQLIKVLNRNKKRYPDDVLIHGFWEYNDPDLVWAFSQALNRMQK
jgi:hypothetical protein